MSRMNLTAVMDRIRTATPDSQIAVFRTGDRGYLDAMFCNTIVTLRRIANQDAAFIGVYDGTMDCKSIHKNLSLCARKRA